MYNWPLIEKQLRSILEHACAMNEECGCQLTVFHHGETVVDIAAGVSGGENPFEIKADSIFPLFSCGKAVLSAAVLQSVGQGNISLDTRLAEFWPEFASPLREEVTVEHVLSHRAGMYILPQTTSLADLADWDKMSRLTAALTPRTVPGTKCAYHAITFAWLAGNILTRTENRPLPEILTDRILRPCGIENELFFGTDEVSDRRFVMLDDSAMPENPSWFSIRMHDPVIRHSCIPSFNGCGSARGLARFYAALSGQLPGCQLLSPEMVDLATMHEYRRADDIMPESSWKHFGLGFVLAGPGYNRTRIYGHGGAAGAEGFYDRDTGIAWGFTKNRPLPSHPLHPIRNRLSEILNIPVRCW